MAKTNLSKDFEQVARLIEDSRNRTFQKVNQELIHLYFKVGGIVSTKVADGKWGDGTVDELAAYIGEKHPLLKGFNRMGLYRMRQFYETYTAPEFVSPLAAQSKRLETGNPKNQDFRIVSTLLTQIPWSSHLHILSKAQTPEEKMFYLHLVISEKLSVRELERQLNSATFERTMASNKLVSALRTQLPKNLFKDPYIFEPWVKPKVTISVVPLALPICVNGYC